MCDRLSNATNPHSSERLNIIIRSSIDDSEVENYEYLAQVAEPGFKVF